MAEKIGPSYLLVANDIRSRITSGEFAVGSLIPSTKNLQDHYGQSETVVRRAVRELQAKEILVGHPGKGVFVRAMPDAAESDLADLKALREELSELSEKLTDVQDRVGRLEASLATVAGKPRGGKREQQSRATADGGRH